MKQRTFLWLALALILVGLVGLIYLGLYSGGFGVGTGVCPWCGGRGTIGPGITSPGMMRGFRGPSGIFKKPSVKPITIEKALEIAEEYISGDNRLEIDEIIEFPDSYEVEFREKAGIHAFEILIDKATGDTYFEMGPNMMWNTKYGMMQGGWGMMRGRYLITPTTETPISEEEAKAIVEDYIKKNNLGLKVEEAEVYYGYYEFHAEKDGKPFAQINVDGYSGQVWYESWHGPILKVKEVAKE